MVFLACSILCCLNLKRSLPVLDRDRDPLKEEELLSSNRFSLISCQAVSNTFKKSLKFLIKLDIPLSFKCRFPLLKCFFTLILYFTLLHYLFNFCIISVAPVLSSLISRITSEQISSGILSVVRFVVPICITYASGSRSL